MADFDVHLTDAVIGAEVTGIDLARPLTGAARAALDALLDERSVLCFPGQRLDEAAYIAFARNFGSVRPAIPPRPDWSPDGFPEIMRVSNIKHDGRDIGHGDAGSVWHSDMSFTAVPPRATLLYAREVPVRDGVTLGATNFASAVAAHAALPAATRARITGLEAVHNVYGRRAGTGRSVNFDAERKALPDVAHPLARVNPHSGAMALFVNTGECIAVPGLGDDEALALIAELAEFIQQDAFRLRHDWRVDDVVIWDNGAVQHLATFDYHWPAERRLLWRLTVMGADDIEYEIE